MTELPFTVESGTELIGYAEDLHGAVDGVKMALDEGHPGPLTVYKDGVAVETWSASPGGPRVSIPSN